MSFPPPEACLLAVVVAHHIAERRTRCFVAARQLFCQGQSANHVNLVHDTKLDCGAQRHLLPAPLGSVVVGRAWPLEWVSYSSCAGLVAVTGVLSGDCKTLAGPIT